MEIVTDPQGIVHGGKTWPLGTPVEELKGSDGHLRAWRRFKQIGEPETTAPAENSSPAAKPAAKAGK